jgi:hypothetical protein
MPLSFAYDVFLIKPGNQVNSAFCVSRISARYPAGVKVIPSPNPPTMPAAGRQLYADKTTGRTTAKMKEKNILPDSVTPTHYALTLQLNTTNFTFAGNVVVEYVNCAEI